MENFDGLSSMKMSEKDKLFDISQYITRVATGYDDFESEEEWDALEQTSNEGQPKNEADVEDFRENDQNEIMIPRSKKLQSSMILEGDFDFVEVESRCSCRRMYNRCIGELSSK